MTAAQIIPFQKYQSVGNDFVLIDVTESLAIPKQIEPSLAQAMCNRHTGIGSDGLIVLRDHEMTFLNPDGTYDVCGNGMRCVGNYLGKKTKKKDFVIGTAAGDISVKIQSDLQNSSVRIQTVHPSIFAPRSVSIGEYSGWMVDPGTPHFCLFVDDIKAFPVRQVGAWLEHNVTDYPVSVDFIEKGFDVNADVPMKVNIRIWERAVGETLGCGTAGLAVSTTLCAMLNLQASRFEINSPGGMIQSEINSQGSFLVADAAFVFSGDYSFTK